MAKEATGESAQNGAANILGLVPDGYYTRAQVAKKIGRSTDTIKRWHESGYYKASHIMQIGRLDVWLYNDADVETLMMLREQKRRGRRPVLSENREPHESSINYVESI